MVNKRKLKLDDMNKKKEEIAKYESNIKKTNKTIKKLTPEYKQYSTLFHTKAEVEGLYQTLSYYAGLNGLVISSIKKEVPTYFQNSYFDTMLLCKYLLLSLFLTIFFFRKKLFNLNSNRDAF